MTRQVHKPRRLSLIVTSVLLNLLTAYVAITIVFNVFWSLGTDLMEWMECGAAAGRRQRPSGSSGGGLLSGAAGK